MKYSHEELAKLYDQEISELEDRINTLKSILSEEELAELYN